MGNELDSFVGNYDYRNGVMGFATDYCASIFMRNMVGTSVLELGPAEGVMTDKLYPYYSDYSCVEGSSYFAEALQKKYPGISVYCSYFENFKPERLYDNIILGHVLEHVDNPVEVLSLCRSWLAEDGRILSAVPNSHSLHRQASVKMGLLKAEDELNDTDRSVGHKRVYNRERFTKDFIDAGLEIVDEGGYWIKPLPNSLIERDWTAEQIEAYMEMGELYPDIAAEIYCICK